MSFQKGNEYGKHTKRGKDVLTQEIKEKIRKNVTDVLDTLMIEAFTQDQKLKYLQVILPYIMPKQKQISHDMAEDVPLFIDSPPQVVVFKTKEERELWENADDVEKQSLVKPYTFKDQVEKFFEDD